MKFNHIRQQKKDEAALLFVVSRFNRKTNSSLLENSYNGFFIYELIHYSVYAFICLFLYFSIQLSA